MKRRELTVEDLMSTALVTATPAETVSDVDVEMKLANVRHIPIVDPHGRLIGIASQRDILRAMAQTRTGPISIRYVMTTQVRTVQRDTPAGVAAGLMLEHKIGSLPVLGDDGQLIGLVTESDFVRLARELLDRQPAARRVERVG